MKWKTLIFLFIAFSANAKLTNIEELGRLLFQDTNLSEPKGQSCSSCHIISKAFANNDIVTKGADAQLSGNRNTPSIAYSSFSPSFKYDVVEGAIVPVGGQFLDGRADTLENQVLMPIFNPLEMANTSTAQFVNKVKSARYWHDIEKYGSSPLM